MIWAYPYFRNLPYIYICIYLMIVYLHASKVLWRPCGHLERMQESWICLQKVWMWQKDMGCNERRQMGLLVSDNAPGRRQLISISTWRHDSFWNAYIKLGVCVAMHKPNRPFFWRQVSVKLDSSIFHSDSDSLFFWEINMDVEIIYRNVHVLISQRNQNRN